jgi:two-component system, CitB family, sensor kinase
VPEVSIGRLRPLANQLLLLQVAVVLVTVFVGTFISFQIITKQVDQEYERRALAIGHAVAEMPDVLEAFDLAQPSTVIQPLAEAIRKGTGASFVVVANQDGIRYSHPNPARIGERVSTDPSQALSGEDFVGIEVGTLGRSVRGKVPIRGPDGQVMGIVSVGFLEDAVNTSLAASVPILALSAFLAFGLGLSGSLLIARRLRRQTFGLGPGEIGSMLEEREAVLHSIREGVLVTDADGRVALLNDEARRLLSIDEASLGRPIDEVIPAGPVRDVLNGTRGSRDELVVAGDRVLVVNRIATEVRGETVGAVATLRDRTELEGALRELDTERSLAHALRAQAHEFFNKLHAVSGLLELDRVEEAVDLISMTTHVHQELVDRVRLNIGDLNLAALLLAKASVASDRGVDFRLAADSHLDAGATNADALVTIVGNLVDNAIDAAAGSQDAWVEVAISDAADGGVQVSVRDSGPGVTSTNAEEIWKEGFTTKRGTAHHGLGLALVRQLAERRGGWVRVSSDGATEFRALLPAANPGLR